MPIYEYKCKECGNVHSKVRNMADIKKPSRCVCGGEATFVMSRPGRFQRGSGWASRVDTPMPGQV